MFKVNLEEELINSKTSSLTKEEKLALKEAEKLLKNNSEEKLQQISGTGLDWSINEKRRIEEVAKAGSEFDQSRVFTGEEIKKLCLTYGLRFLNIEHYKGEVDENLPSKMEEFEKIYKEKRPSSYYGVRHRDYMICAPSSSFKLSEYPKDPLLFYPLGSNKYYLVHKWGNDLSVWNMIKAWRKKNIWNWAAFTFSTNFAAIMLLSSLMGGFLGVVGSAIVSFVILVIGSFTLQCISDGEYLGNRFTEQNWDSKFK